MDDVLRICETEYKWLVEENEASLDRLFIQRAINAVSALPGSEPWDAEMKAAAVSRAETFFQLGHVRGDIVLAFRQSLFLGGPLSACCLVTLKRANQIHPAFRSYVEKNT